MSEPKRIKRAITWLISQGILKSQKEFGELLGITNRSYLSQLVNSETPSIEMINMLTKLSDQISKSWLLTGEGEMLKPKEQKAEENAEMLGRAFRASTPDEGVVNVRYFSVTPTATFQEFCDEESGEPEYIPVVAPSGELIDESSCVFKIFGESMAPLIHNHAKVLCREIPPSRWHNIRSGVIVIAYKDRFVIKRIVKNRLAAEDYLVISSDNPDFKGNEKVFRADIRCIFEARQVLSYPIR